MLLAVVIYPLLPNGYYASLAEQQIVDISQIPFWLLPTLFCLSVINYGIESLKWQIIAGLTEKISYKKAVKGVLAGAAFSNIFPWKTGEFIGKVSYLKAENKVKGTYLSVYSSMTQLFITLLMGIISIAFITQINFLSHIKIAIPSSLYPFAIGASALLLVFVMFLRNKLWKWVSSFFGPRLKYYAKSFTSIPLKTSVRLLVLSFIRYCFFVLPYIIVIHQTEAVLQIGVIALLISLGFLAQTPLPGIIWSDLAIKGFIHLSLFLPFITYNWSVGNAVLLVFIFNQIIPSVAGIILLFTSTKEKHKQSNTTLIK